jgi:hypothetical protein
MSIVLNEKQLAELTGKIRPSAQARQLHAMGIDFRQRIDGSIVVLHADLVSDQQRKSKTVNLNLEAV